MKQAPLCQGIDLNEQFLKALHIMEESQQNVFITGRAGTGKSTLLDYFRRQTEKKVAILAPTGVAAVNVKGQTIHSFFKFKPNITPQTVKRLRESGDKKKNIYQKLEMIIIDEISMVRADLLDCVDKFLRLNGKTGKKPFGGIQMVFIGDLYQLAPVVTSEEKPLFSSHYETPYFFSAHVFKDFEMDLLELEKIYRQKDETHIQLLNAIRNNSITEEGLEKINARYDPDFEPRTNDFFIYLTPTNAQASLINEKELGKVKGKFYEFHARVSGDFSKEYYPTALALQVKVGAQVMMLNNDAGQRWVNGTIGKVVDIYADEEDRHVISIRMEQGKTCEVYPYTWEIYKFSLEENQLKSGIVGTYTQYPLMLAWAVTIHKSQGKTFERVIIDMGKGAFAHGQSYVALSRCISLDGMVLKKRFTKNHIRMDHNVMKFLTRYQYQKSEKACPVEDKITLIQEAITSGKNLQIVYLRANDEKSTRMIKPHTVGERVYAEKSYMGMEGYCHTRQENRIFRVDRILDLKIAEG